MKALKYFNIQVLLFEKLDFSEFMSSNVLGLKSLFSWIIGLTEHNIISGSGLIAYPH